MQETEKLLSTLDMDPETINKAFNYAMKDFEQHRRKFRDEHAGTPIRRHAYDELVDSGRWTPEWMSAEFVRVVNGDSAEPRRIRDFISAVGWKAEERIHQMNVRR